MHSATNQKNKERKRNDDDPVPPQSVSPSNTGLDFSSACRQEPMADHNTNFDLTFDRVYPIGYRFLPTDQELITHFLLNMINNQDLPKNKIGNVDTYQDHPQNIVVNHPQSNEGQWYFFTPRNRKYVNSSRADRKAGDGYWKAIKSYKEITEEDGTKIGVKKTLVYHQGNDRIKTDWMMQEFLVAADHPRLRLDKSYNKLNDYVLCKIYKKNNTGGRQQANTNHADPTIPNQEPRPEQRVTQYHPCMNFNPLYRLPPSFVGLQRDIVYHDMRYGQPFGLQVPPPHRPPPQPHVGLFPDESNYIAGFNRSAGPSSSINPQPLSAPSDDYSWDLTELEQQMNSQKPKAPR